MSKHAQSLLSTICLILHATLTLAQSQSQPQSVTAVYALPFNQACAPTIPDNTTQTPNDTVRFDTFTSLISLPRKILGLHAAGYTNYSGQVLMHLDLLLDTATAYSVRIDPCTSGIRDLCPSFPGPFAFDLIFQYVLASTSSTDPTTATNDSESAVGLKADHPFATTLQSALQDPATYVSSSSLRPTLQLRITTVDSKPFTCVQAGLTDDEAKGVPLDPSSAASSEAEATALPGAPSLTIATTSVTGTESASASGNGNGDSTTMSGSGMGPMTGVAGGTSANMTTSAGIAAQTDSASALSGVTNVRWLVGVLSIYLLPAALHLL